MNRMKEVQARLIVAFVSLERRLQSDHGIAEMVGKYCYPCHVEIPDGATICVSCHGNNFYAPICTKTDRICRMFHLLGNHGLWGPAGYLLKSMSFVDINERMSDVMKNIDHKCKAGKACSLVHGLTSMKDMIQEIVEGGEYSSLETMV